MNWADFWEIRNTKNGGLFYFVFINPRITNLRRIDSFEIQLVSFFYHIKSNSASSKILEIGVTFSTSGFSHMHFSIGSDVVKKKYINSTLKFVLNYLHILIFLSDTDSSWWSSSIMI